jgi:hypothetical protein
MCGAIPLLPQYSSWRGAQLKYTDNFTFTFFTFYYLYRWLGRVKQHANAFDAYENVCI